MKRIATVFLSLLLLISACPLGAFSIAANVTTLDGLMYEISGDEITITDYTGSATEVVIPAEIEGYPVTTIGKEAFDNNSVTSITIPDSVTSIGSYAFEFCRSLTSITIPDSVTSIGFSAFGFCSSLTSITIPDSVTSIGGRAFSNCSGLISVTIGTGLISLGDNAFAYCFSLTEVFIKDLLSWCNIDFEGTLSNPLCYADNLYIDGEPATDIIIPQGVTEIQPYLLSCISLNSVTIPDSVTNIKNSAFYHCSNLTSITILDSVTSIGNYAFSECTSLTSITIPDSVTSICDGAFYGCSSLTSITIGNSVTSIGEEAFQHCYNLENVNITDFDAWCKINFAEDVSNPLRYADNFFINGELATDVTIPQGVEVIQPCLLNCSSIISVTIPDSVSVVSEGAFDSCDLLSRVFISNLESWCNINFESYPMHDAELYIDGVLATDVTIPQGITSINDYMFRGCSSLTNVTLPDSVTIIGDSAFEDCRNLTSINIPDSVMSIDEDAFHGCDSLVNTYISDFEAWCNINFTDSYSNPLRYADNLFINGEIATDVTIPQGVTIIQPYLLSFSSLASINIPDSVTSIGDSAFYGCSSLTSVIIPNSVTFIGDRAFFWCTGLTNITIPDSVTSIGDGAFEECESLTSITIPDGVTIIGKSAFEDCTSLTSITIPNSVTFIGDNAFRNCSGLISVTIPDSVESIGDWTFYGCSNLTSVTIPDSVESIGEYAFEGCSSLTSITIPDSVTRIGDSAFYDCSNLTSITIPDGVTIIGKAAFEFCYSLADVWYDGNESDRQNIRIGEYNENLTEATWHYNFKSGCMNHKYDFGKITLKPTCESQGTKTYGCTICGVTKTENISALGHNIIVIPAKKATYTETGLTQGKKCSICNKITISQQIVAKLKKTSFKNAKVTVKDQTYSGKAKEPVVTIKLNGKTLKKNVDYTVTYKNNKNVGKATVTIKGIGKYTGSVSKTFAINPKKVSSLKIKNGKKQLKVSWKKDTKVTGYEIQYSTSKKFKSAKKVTVKKAKTTSATIKKLKAKKTYYVRIRTYKTVKGKKYYSAWSKVLKKKTK